VIATVGNLERGAPYADVIAFADGKERWRAAAGEPFVRDGAVIAHGHDHLIALSPSDGAILWKRPSPKPILALLPTLRGAVAVLEGRAAASINLDACRRGETGCFIAWPRGLPRDPDPSTRFETSPEGDIVCAGHEGVSLVTADGRISELATRSDDHVFGYFPAASAQTCTVAFHDQHTGANNLLRLKPGCRGGAVWSPTAKLACAESIMTLPPRSRAWRSVDGWLLNREDEESLRQRDGSPAREAVGFRSLGPLVYDTPDVRAGVCAVDEATAFCTIGRDRRLQVIRLLDEIFSDSEYQPARAIFAERAGHIVTARVAGAKNQYRIVVLERTGAP
jgi:hypothetical protein